MCEWQGLTGCSECVPGGRQTAGRCLCLAGVKRLTVVSAWRKLPVWPGCVRCGSESGSRCVCVAEVNRLGGVCYPRVNRLCSVCLVGMNRLAGAPAWRDLTGCPLFVRGESESAA